MSRHCATVCVVSRVSLCLCAHCVLVGDTHERRRTVARDTVQSVRSVCLLSVVLCVSFFHRLVVAGGLTVLAFASTPSQRERPRFTRDPRPDRHSPNICARQTRISYGCAGHRAECAECLLVVRGTVCVLFSQTGRCARSHRTGLCQHAFPKGEASVHPRPMTGQTLPQHLCAADQNLEPLAACLGTKVASARCQSLPRIPLRQRFLAGRTAPVPDVVLALNTLAGCIPP